MRLPQSCVGIRVPDLLVGEPLESVENPVEIAAAQRNPVRSSQSVRRFLFVEVRKLCKALRRVSPVSAVQKRESGRWSAVVCHAVAEPEAAGPWNREHTSKDGGRSRQLLLVSSFGYA